MAFWVKGKAGGDIVFNKCAFIISPTICINSFKKLYNSRFRVLSSAQWDTIFVLLFSMAGNA
jgi:hypothetical protein